MDKKKSDGETMIERYRVKVGGKEFEIKPITLVESFDYIRSGALMFRTHKIVDGVETDEEYSEKELGMQLIANFRPLDTPDPEPIMDEYAKFPREIQYTIYWLQKKVFLDGEPIVFSELETKHGLSKGEIAILINALSEKSGF